jgi:uncharacterized protein (DUF1015 family)
MTHPKLKSFEALRYDSKIPLKEVVTPPYDVINPEMQSAFYDRSPFNLVRVDLARAPGDLRYAHAKETFTQWMKEGVLKQDKKPALYFHHQTFTLADGRTITRKGFFGVRRVEDFSEGGIKPHEKTLEGPKMDRLKLTRALACQMSPVFSLYADPAKKIDGLVAQAKQKPADIDFRTVEGERHEMWLIEDEKIHEQVDAILGNQPLFIADGHHRYETSINYRNERRKASPPGDGMEPFNYVLMYFSNMNDDGLIILPIHRALHNLQNFKVEDLVKKLESTFAIETLGELDNAALVAKLDEAGKGHHAFAMITKDKSKSYIVKIAHDKWLERAQGIPSSLVGLDVTVLHRLVFEDLLGISQAAQANQENIIYWKDTTRAINETRGGACDVTFLLNSTRIGDMERVASAGEKMPQKSTYFYPKILSGLVIHPV